MPHSARTQRTVARPMRELSLRGARRGKRSAPPSRTRPRPGQRTWWAAGSARPHPDRLWVAGYTYVPAWSGLACVAFVIDAYSRRILGWRAVTSMRTVLVLDALERALWTRRRDGRDLAGLVHHADAGSQGCPCPNALSAWRPGCAGRWRCAARRPPAARSSESPCSSRRSGPGTRP